MRTFTSQILTPQIVISYILASASHLHIFISQVFFSDLQIFTFTFRSSYFETTSCLHIFGSSSRSRAVLSYHLQDFIAQLFLQFYNLIYVRLQNFISPLSGQPSSSCLSSSARCWSQSRSGEATVCKKIFPCQLDIIQRVSSDDH